MITPGAIIDAVAHYYGIKVRDLRGTGRWRRIAYPRAVGMYLTRRLTLLSFPDIGGEYGGKDHSTVIWAVRKVERWLRDGSGIPGFDVAADVAALCSQFGVPVPALRPVAAAAVARPSAEAA